MATGVIVCSECSKNVIRCTLQFYNGFIGNHNCSVCNKVINCSTDTYSVFSSDIVSKLKNKILTQQIKDNHAATN